MKNATILTVVGKDAALDDLAATMETIRAVSARVAILVVGEVPAFPYYAIGVPPYGISEVPADWQADLTESRSILLEKAQEIEKLLDQHGVSGEVTSVAGDLATVINTISQKAMYCDVAMVGNDLRATESLFNQAVHGVLFASPIGVVLNDKHAKAFTGAKRVFVAWNTQIHSARAVHQALPILKCADEVIIASIDPLFTAHGDGEDPGVDIAKWLTQHRCKVVVQQYPSGGLSVGECILARSEEAGADLIVMGSYGHSRARQALFGGTTRTMISQINQAVFLAH